MIAFNKIDKSSLVDKPFEHMLIDFVDPTYIIGVFKPFSLDHRVLNKLEHFSTVSSHPIEQILVHYYQQLIDKVNDIWDCGVTGVQMSTSKFDKDSKLILHNDHHCEEQIPVRGILYLNNAKEFGTTLFSSPNEDGIEVGGCPGQLLLFRVTENSWHSAGTENFSTSRFTSNWIFTR